jgi:hypothetical protein
LEEGALGFVAAEEGGGVGVGGREVVGWVLGGDCFFEGGGGGEEGGAGEECYKIVATDVGTLERVRDGLHWDTQERY